MSLQERTNLYQFASIAIRYKQRIASARPIFLSFVADQDRFQEIESIVRQNAVPLWNSLELEFPRWNPVPLLIRRPESALTI